jgi:hypothetical protein
MPHNVYKKVYLPENPQRTENESDSPGPGQYNDKSRMVGTNGKKITMKFRTKNILGKFKEILTNLSIDPMEIEIKKNSPPPGIYGYGIEINGTGNYPLSTILNAKAPSFSKSKNRFFLKR